MNSDDLLRQGINAYKQKQTGKARQLLQKAVELDPANEKAWLWLSGVMKSDEERRNCLEKVLEINPENGAAKKGLSLLKSKPVQRTVPQQPKAEAIPKQPKAEAIPAEIIETTISAATIPDAPAARPKAAPKPKPKKQTNDNLLLFGAIGFLVLVILCASLVLLGRQVSREGISSAESEVDHKAQIMALLHENLVSYNAGDIERYMATIHSDSRGYDQTREGMETLISSYELRATFDKVEILEVSNRRARVDFSLTTKKISGPAFRNNRIEGVFNLRQEDGQWKIYDQDIENVDYLD